MVHECNTSPPPIMEAIESLALEPAGSQMQWVIGRHADGFDLP